MVKINKDSKYTQFLYDSYIKVTIERLSALIVIVKYKHLLLTDFDRVISLVNWDSLFSEQYPTGTYTLLNHH